MGNTHMGKTYNCVFVRFSLKCKLLKKHSHQQVLKWVAVHAGQRADGLLPSWRKLQPVLHMKQAGRHHFMRRMIACMYGPHSEVGKQLQPQSKVPKILVTHIQATIDTPGRDSDFDQTYSRTPESVLA